MGECVLRRLGCWDSGDRGDSGHRSDSGDSGDCSGDILRGDRTGRCPNIRPYGVRINMSSWCDSSLGCSSDLGDLRGSVQTQLVCPYSIVLRINEPSLILRENCLPWINYLRDNPLTRHCSLIERSLWEHRCLNNPSIPLVLLELDSLRQWTPHKLECRPGEPIDVGQNSIVVGFDRVQIGSCGCEERIDDGEDVVDVSCVGSSENH